MIEVAALKRAYRRQRSEAAVGVDGVTKETDGQDVESHLQDLHTRRKAKRYRHQPIRRVHITKAQGTTRPIGLSAFAATGVQDAVREGLEAIDAQNFWDCSHGFRSGRSAHAAVRPVKRIVAGGEVRWLCEADLGSFFDSVARTELRKRREVRVADGSLLRRIGQCVPVEVLEGEGVSVPALGPVQGSGLSPLLGNVYLPSGLDRWFDTEVQPRLQGTATLMREKRSGCPAACGGGE